MYFKNCSIIIIQQSYRVDKDQEKIICSQGKFRELIRQINILA